MKQQFVEKMNYIFADLSLPSDGRGNAPTELASLLKKLLESLQQLFMKKREAATHLISQRRGEIRNLMLCWLEYCHLNQ